MLSSDTNVHRNPRFMREEEEEAAALLCGRGNSGGWCCFREWRGEKGREGSHPGRNETMRVDTQARSEMDRSSNDVVTAAPLV